MNSFTENMGLVCCYWFYTAICQIFQIRRGYFLPKLPLSGRSKPPISSSVYFTKNVKHQNVLWLALITKRSVSKNYSKKVAFKLRIFDQLYCIGHAWIRLNWQGMAAYNAKTSSPTQWHSQSLGIYTACSMTAISQSRMRSLENAKASQLIELLWPNRMTVSHVLY